MTNTTFGSVPSYKRSLAHWVAAGLVGICVPGLMGCTRGASQASPASLELGSQSPGSGAGLTPPAATQASGAPASRGQTPIMPPPPDKKVRTRATVRADGKRDLTFDDLEFKIERNQDFKDEMLTDAIHGLEGKPVVIRGFMLAGGVFQQSGITQFVLVRDNQECCFGPGAYIYHNVQVDMVAGQTATFSSRPVTIEGTFHIRPFRVGGKCYSIYHVTADKAR